MFTLASASRALNRSIISLSRRNFAVATMNSASDLKNAVDKNNGLLVIKWYAEWCMPCKQCAPALARLSDENPNVTFVEADIDEIEFEEEGFPEVTSLPTFLIVKDKSVVDVIMGANIEKVSNSVAKHQ